MAPRTRGKEKVIMGQSLYRYIAHRLDRLDVYVVKYGIYGLLKWSMIKWMKIKKSFLLFLKMPVVFIAEFVVVRVTTY